MPKGSKRSKSTEASAEEPKGSKGSEASAEESCFNRPMKLSPNLADIVGMNEASPKECIRKLWAYQKSNNLQDPKDRQYFTPDKKMAKVFGKDRIKAFDMMKYIDNHLTKIDSKSDVNVFQAGPGTLCEPRIMELISNLLTITDDTTGGQFTTLTCRSIRIGSYKILTKEKVKKKCQNRAILLFDNFLNIFRYILRKRPSI